MSRRPEQPLRRRSLLAGAVVGLVALLAIVGLAEGLSHPRPGMPRVEVPLGDPRDELICPETELAEEESGEPEQTFGPARPPAAVGSGELLDCPESYNGQVVRYQGEVVGGLVQRDGGAWTQLNDDAYADPVGPFTTHRSYRGGNSGIGAFLPDDVVEQITTVGGPGAHGDLVEVVGVFRRVDPASKEAAVILVQRATIVQAGWRLEVAPLRDREVAAAMLALLAVGTVITERVVARRRARM